MLNTKLLGGTASAPAVYVDDVFSTYLYTGNSSTQTINNGIDLAGEGGMVWVKQRGPAGNNHQLADTVRGASSQLASNTTAAATSETNRFTSFNSDGFSLDSGTIVNNSTQTYCSWTFREQAKFFDVVTYTGDGTASRNISHSLDSTPGMIIVKKTNSATNSDWWTWHRSISTGNLSANNLLRLNLTNAQLNLGTVIGTANSTSFQVGDDTSINASGSTYVAYLFAHDAGGFGAAGTDNVISCGSVVLDGSGNGTVNLGYEPQYVLVKSASSASNWLLFDNMRGIATGGDDALLRPNLSDAELAVDFIDLTSTGFQLKGVAINATVIYMAIRRPMKPPTSGTQVFAVSGYTITPNFTSGFPVDWAMRRDVSGTAVPAWWSRLTSGYLVSSAADAENPTPAQFDIMNGFTINGAATSYGWMFRRAPKFFDVVCYTGTGSARTVAHNLGVAPELMIVKSRNGVARWGVYTAATGATNRLLLDATSSASADSAYWNDTNPTSSVFTVESSGVTNGSGTTYVAYLFASVAGVSKVFSFTGNGSSQTINCGFTAGARLVLIKRTDSTGDWYIWDTARGIVSGNDPHLSLNTTAAEVTSNDSIDPDNSGFIVNQLSATNINVSSATYIGLAIA